MKQKIQFTSGRKFEMEKVFTIKSMSSESQEIRVNIASISKVDAVKEFNRKYNLNIFEILECFKTADPFAFAFGCDKLTKFEIQS